MGEKDADMSRINFAIEMLMAKYRKDARKTAADFYSSISSSYETINRIENELSGLDVQETKTREQIDCLKDCSIEGIVQIREALEMRAIEIELKCIELHRGLVQYDRMIRVTKLTLEPLVKYILEGALEKEEKHITE